MRFGTTLRMLMAVVMKTLNSQITINWPDYRYDPGEHQTGGRTANRKCRPADENVATRPGHMNEDTREFRPGYVHRGGETTQYWIRDGKIYFRGRYEPVRGADIETFRYYRVGVAK